MIKVIVAGDVLQFGDMFYKVLFVNQDAVITERCPKPEEKEEVIEKVEKVAKKKKR